MKTKGHKDSKKMHANSGGAAAMHDSSRKISLSELMRRLIEPISRQDGKKTCQTLQTLRTGWNGIRLKRFHVF